MIKFITEKGIVINKKDLGEADRYVTVFTENFGKLEFYIKGIRKSKKREIGATDTLSLTQFEFYKKNDLYNVTNFTGLDSYVEIKSNFFNLELVVYILSVLNTILLENNRKKKLFNITLKTLDVLKQSEDEKKNYLLLAYYLYYIIKNEGLEINDSKGQFFSFEKSMFLENYEEFSLKVSEDEKKVILYIILNKLKELNRDEYKLEIIIKIVKLFEKYINYHFGLNIRIKNYVTGLDK